MRFGPLLGVLVSGVVTLGALSPAVAGPNPGAKLLVHLVRASDKSIPGCFGNAIKTAEEVVTRGEVGQRYYAYILIADVDTTSGIAGIQFGINYDDAEGSGVDIDAWQECSLYQWHLEDWPASNTGNLLTWSQNAGCQRKTPIVVGYFTLIAYSKDRLKIIPRPVDGLAQIAACGIKAMNSAEKVDNLLPENLGWVDFGEGMGYNPWDPKQNLLLIQEQIKR